MYHLDNESGVSTFALAPVKNTQRLWFTEGGQGNAISYPGADWFNMVQAELLSILDDAGITPDKGQLNQISLAIRKMATDKAEDYLKELAKADAYKLVGCCKSVAELRTIRPTEHGQRILVKSYYVGGTTGGGEFVADLQDLVTPDDGGTCFVVNGNGGRWKRVYSTISVIDFGAKPEKGFDNTQAFINAARTMGEGGSIMVPKGTFELNTIKIPPVRLIGEGQGATILSFDNTQQKDGIVFTAPNDENIEFGLSHLTIKTVNGHGRYCITTPSFEGGNSKYLKPIFEFLSFNSQNTEDETDSFAQTYSWQFIFNFGDSWNLTVRAIDAQGSYVTAKNPDEQFLDGFIRFTPTQGILSARISNITTHNIANCIEVRQKTYFSLSDIDFARCFKGVYDADDRVFEKNVYAYGESIWDNVIINAQRVGVKLKNRYGLIANGLIIHKAGDDYTTDWVGLHLERARNCQFLGFSAGANSKINAVGVIIDSGDGNIFTGAAFGALKTCIQIGVTSSQGAAQSVVINGINLISNVGKVFDVQNARNLKCVNFTKSSGVAYDEFVTFSDSTSKLTSTFLNCMTDPTIEHAGSVYFDNKNGGDNVKRWRADFSNGLSLSTQTDNGSVGNNALIITRDGTKITKFEARVDKDTGYALVNAPQTHFAGFVKPNQDGVFHNGRPDFRWDTVYSATGAINTSDARLKQDIKEIDDKVINAWRNVNFCQYRWITAVQDKQDEARIHLGLIAQKIKSAFESEGLDACDYGLLCHDSWDETPEIIDSDGVIVQQYNPAGERWGIRSDECLFLEAESNRRRLLELESRIANLEGENE